MNETLVRRLATRRANPLLHSVTARGATVRTAPAARRRRAPSPTSPSPCHSPASAPACLHRIVQAGWILGISWRHRPAPPDHRSAGPSRYRRRCGTLHHSRAVEEVVLARSVVNLSTKVGDGVHRHDVRLPAQVGQADHPREARVAKRALGCARESVLGAQQGSGCKLGERRLLTLCACVRVRARVRAFRGRSGSQQSFHRRLGIRMTNSSSQTLQIKRLWRQR